MTLLVIIAAGWGYTNGGINVFNRELCKGLGKYVSDQLRVLCIAPDISQEEIDKVYIEEKIVLLTVSNEEFEDPSFIVNKVNSYCELEKITDSSVIWLGHDTYSDGQALQCRDAWDGSRCALIHHMSYGTYYPLINLDTDKSEEKEKRQREHLSSADIVFANGPLLKESAQDLCGRENDIFEILPGVFEVATIQDRSPNFFNVVSFGRVEPQNDFKRSNSIIKQIFLSVASWANFTSGLGPSDHSSMKIYGKNYDASDEEFIKLIKNYAGIIFPFSAIPYEKHHDKLLEALSNFSLCLFLSSKEGFGLVALEAISAGVPVIVSESSGFYLALKNKLLDGFVYHVPIEGALDEPYFSDKDLENVTAKIREVFDNKKTAKRKALRLREELIKSGFTWENCAGNILNKLGVLSKQEIEQCLSNKGKIIIVTGFSAVGVGAVVNQLLSFDNYETIIQATSRSRRLEEQDGNLYYFLTKEDFEERLQDNRFFEYSFFQGNYYGTYRDHINSKIKQDINVVFEMNMSDAFKIKKQYPETIIVTIFPRNVNTLINQLFDREEDYEQVIERLNNYSELAYTAFKGDILLVNDNSQKTAERLNDIINNPAAKKVAYEENVELVVSLKRDIDYYLRNLDSTDNNPDAESALVSAVNGNSIIRASFMLRHIISLVDDLLINYIMLMWKIL